MARRGFQGAVMRGFGARDHEATVLDTELLAPRFRRVWLASETLLADAVAAPTAWLRFWFPDPHGGDLEHQRGYTIAAADEQAGTFAVDFVLHEPTGPASHWAQHVAPGTTIAVTSLGSSRFDVPDELPAGYLLIGDAASVPAISGILRVLPADLPVRLYLEEHERSDRLIPIPEHPRLITRWVPRRGPSSLATAVAAGDWSDWYAWVGAESGSLKQVRTRLRDDFGFPKSEVHAQAYWYQGRAMGKFRGTAEREPSTAPAARPRLDHASRADEADPAATAAQRGPHRHLAAGTRPGTTPAARAEPRPEPAVRADRRTRPAGHGEPGAESAGHGEPGAEPADFGEPGAASVGSGGPGTEPAGSGEPGGPAARDAGTSPAVGDRGAARGTWRTQAAGRLIAPLRPTMVVAGVVQAVVTLLQLAPFVLLAELARLLLDRAETARLWTVGPWAVGLLAAGALLSSGLLLWLHAVDARFERELRQRLLTRLSRLPLGWFDARGSGRIKHLVQDDTLALHHLVTHAVPDAVAAVVAPVAVLGYLFAVDWRLALLLFLPVLVYLVTMWVMIVQSGTRAAQAQRWAERMDGEAGGYLAGQPVIRVFGGAAGSTFRARLDEYIGFLNAWQRPFSRQKTLMDLATRPATFLLLIVVAGTLFVATGGMAPTTVLPFLLLGTSFGARLLGIGFGLSGLRGGLVAARRIQVALDEPELRTESAPPDGSARPRGVEPAPGRVEFDRVGFCYRPGVPVLQEVSATLEPGTMTALVGPSGSGKSTLAALLARFHDVTDGAIRIGGRDIRGLTADELYGRVGFVFQQVQLVHGTVRDNIALAVPDADQQRIEAAARAAQIHERILRLPDGYDTVLGPDAALSGGERQRITIARAILADTPVLILDEATAFADPESEYLVQQALNRLTAGRTVLVIAHRLHTVTGADRLIVLDHGRIAETGTHAELRDRDGRYRRLWDAGAARSAAPDRDRPTTEAAR